ncbi:NAD(P)-dependent dehydrogenase (short-subunit alcohol dehydrogenase family) [Erwinia persicina]|jgi:NAD(P)-dependent dehydrogenase (short-subunit alcohol dehydrogenase family)|uniref:SDR family oxidoreductase n=2 Tax=Erwinia TaxID=551 RepID=A0ABV4EE73_9GAMM|nr:MULTISPECIES: SDR family oxidoreductase [Erwinia]MCP1440820.1 NAD(P)-dependent dehydrogenase (short-subunit alcohol dehydrogenase family) [Erwinia persicina]MDN4629026.1 SDR family oxidoreductase [Erwinia sp. PsM31]MDN8543917.1 SDR family oxidoreductase [Erwinia sp. BC051422]
MLQEKVAVITGGTSGVGRASAQAFAEAGYAVAVIGRSEQSVKETIEELKLFGVQASGAAVDVADGGALLAAGRKIEAELGPINVWVNAAMLTVLAPVTQITDEEFQRVTDVTYLGCVHGTRTALTLMGERDEGIIVQVGSALAYRSVPLQSAYCAAKAAIRGFTDSLRSELLHNNSSIRLTMVHLPGVNTPQFDWSRNKMGNTVQPMPPIFQPEVAARAILKAARHAPREVWVGRSTFQSIVGNMLFPGLLDRMMAKQGWSGQITEEPEVAGRPDNLHQSVEGLHRSHGRFDEKAEQRALNLNVNNPGLTILGVAAVAWLGLRSLRRR